MIFNNIVKIIMLNNNIMKILLDLFIKNLLLT